VSPRQPLLTLRRPAVALGPVLVASPRGGGATLGDQRLGAPGNVGPARVPVPVVVSVVCVLVFRSYRPFTVYLGHIFEIAGHVSPLTQWPVPEVPALSVGRVMRCHAVAVCRRGVRRRAKQCRLGRAARWHFAGRVASSGSSILVSSPTSRTH